MAADKSYQEVSTVIESKDCLLQKSYEEKVEVERRYGVLAESKERLEIELAQAVKAAEIFEKQSQELSSEIQNMKVR
jgi:hypothetical protein